MAEEHGVRWEHIGEWGVGEEVVEPDSYHEGEEDSLCDFLGHG